MIFFTRELYEGFQPNSGWDQRADRIWDRHARIYRKYFRLISPLLPTSARRFAKVSLHDRVVTETTVSKPIIRIHLNGRGAVGVSPFYDYIVAFSGVVGFRGRKPPKGWWWCYDEFHLCSTSPFSFHVLFHQGEIEINAAEVALQKIKRR